MKYILASFFVFLLVEQAALGEDCPAVKISLPKLIKTYSKRANWTQGFHFHDNLLYESTGYESHHFIYDVTRASSALSVGHLPGAASRPFGVGLFGEGITIDDGKIYQVIYNKNFGFVFDLNFKEIGRFTYYPKSGWGITSDRTHLIISNGSDILYYHSTSPIELVRSLKVTVNSTNQVFANISLNELEFANNSIYANLYSSPNFIAKISPVTGCIEEMFDLNQLRQLGVGTLREIPNGIAFDEKENVFFLTGKDWQSIFKVKLE